MGERENPPDSAARNVSAERGDSRSGGVNAPNYFFASCDCTTAASARSGCTCMSEAMT